MRARVLIVDDDPNQCRYLEKMVRKAGYEPESVGGGEQALSRLARTDAPGVSAVILDLVMPDLDGMAVLAKLGSRSSALPVIMQAAPGAADCAASAMRAGAVDFLIKPAAPERLRGSLRNAIRLAALESEVSRMQRSRSGTLGFDDLVLRSSAMQRVAELGQRAARSAVPVLIEGEAGVGKELVGRAVHGSGARRVRPFVAVDCQASFGKGIEAVLFGERAGAGQQAGKIHAARGGTLFLAAIEALPAAAQARLLGTLQASPARLRPPFRLIAATHGRLVDHVSAGRFSAELFNLLNVSPIWVPPLRERRDDILDLARRFLARLAAEHGMPAVSGISGDALALLGGFDWPGNLRQLETAMSRAVARSAAADLQPEDFCEILACRAAGAVARPASERQVAAGEAAAAALPPGKTRLRYGIARLLDEQGHIRSFGAVEEEVIRFALDHHRGHLSEVARRLGIGRSTLYRKLRDYGIGPDEAAA